MNNYTIFVEVGQLVVSQLNDASAWSVSNEKHVCKRGPEIEVYVAADRRTDRRDSLTERQTDRVDFTTLYEEMWKTLQFELTWWWHWLEYHENQIKSAMIAEYM